MAEQPDWQPSNLADAERHCGRTPQGFERNGRRGSFSVHTDHALQTNKASALAEQVIAQPTRHCSGGHQ